MWTQGPRVTGFLTFFHLLPNAFHDYGLGSWVTSRIHRGQAILGPGLGISCVSEL